MIPLISKLPPSFLVIVIVSVISLYVPPVENVSLTSIVERSTVNADNWSFLSKVIRFVLLLYVPPVVKKLVIPVITTLAVDDSSINVSLTSIVVEFV